jgi:hypothetical protein
VVFPEPETPMTMTIIEIVPDYSDELLSLSAIIAEL